MEKNRPLSPHLQIYKPQIGSFTSILHRFTGIFLYIGVVTIAWVIVYYTYQVEIVVEGEVPEEVCECSPYLTFLVYTIILGFVFSLYYHLCNGIRHLFWDIGKGFDLKTSNRNGIIVLTSAALLTLASVCYVIFF